MSQPVSPRPVSSRPVSSRRRVLGRIAIAGAVLVPLAFAGLFVGSLGNADVSLSRVPAAVVNSDELVEQPQADGSTTPVFAGRQLVTELTSPDNDVFEWTVSNKKDADAALAKGEVYAILTVPKSFSKSILSLQSDDPTQATIDIRTDDAHSYLAGVVAGQVGQSMVSAFGSTITEQYLAGVYSSIGTVGASLTTAADGATGIADGVAGLGAGLDSLSSGVASTKVGADGLASGISRYTSGVTSLSSGLGQLNSSAAGLNGISDGVSSFTSGVSQLSAGIAAASAALNDSDTNNDVAAARALAALSAQLAGTAASGPTLADSTSGGIQGVQGGIAKSASGAASLAAGSGSLTSGAGSLASGLGTLAGGASSSAAGAVELETGARDLATGLAAGAGSVPSLDTEAGKKAASVAAAPVALKVERDNPVSDIGRVIAAVFVPLGLWLGAIALFLVLAPVSRSAIASTATTGRLVSAVLRRAVIATLVQAALIVALVHVSIGVELSLLPLTAGFAVVMALAFTAFHYLLTLAFGRAGLVVSLLLFALQLTSTGGIYPVELLAAPFQVLSPLLPLTYGVTGMQAILAGGNPGVIVGAALALVGFGVVSYLASLLVMRSRRAVPVPVPALAA